MAKKKKDNFQSVNKARPKVSKVSESGVVYVDYKDTESLRRLMTGNGKIQGRKRSGANASEQRQIAAAIKRARHMALLPYVTAAQ